MAAERVNILLKTKQARILLILRNSTQEWYVSSIAKASETTYVHACNFINVCNKLGITTSDKHGKRKVIRLTDKGAKIAEMLDAINLLLITERN